MQSFNSITSLDFRGMQFLINYLSITAILCLKPIDTIIEVMRRELLSRAFLKFSTTKVLLVVAANFLRTFCGIYRSLYDRIAIDLISKFFTGLAYNNYYGPCPQVWMSKQSKSCGPTRGQVFEVGLCER